ncbi:hypothetical protein AB0399_24970 [Streptomyces sp. NPDC088194]
MKRRRIASVAAVRVRVVVPPSIIRSYCWAMSAQRIGDGLQGAVTRFHTT